VSHTCNLRASRVILHFRVDEHVCEIMTHRKFIYLLTSGYKIVNYNL